MKKSILAATMTSCFLLCNYALAAENLAGIDLNRTREYLERERVARQIAEDRAKAASKVEGAAVSQQQSEAPDISFELKNITTDPSTVLADTELKAIVNPYVGKKTSVKELYTIVGEINKLYEQKGFVTCRAFLMAQTIKNGIVHITLIEGRTGGTEVVGNKNTKARYIANRLHLREGEVANTKVLNKDLLWFNATNDAQLRVVMKAGAKPGTTDYVIEAYEPKQHNVTVFLDNAGSYSSSSYRQGLFYNAKSISGNRDDMNIGFVRSKGTKALSAAYNRSVGRSGTKLNLSYNTNSVRSVRGTGRELGVKGHANAYAIGITQPWVVNEKVRSEASLEFSRQDSKTDIRNYPGSNFVDDKVNDVTLGFALTNYGKSHVIYQKHNLIYGTYDSVDKDDNFFCYKGTGLYQKAYSHGHMISARAELQHSSKDNLISSRQFYIGGMYSVRGYKENYLGGDGGLNFSAEYSVPVTKDKNTSVFTFFDYGQVWGEVAESNNRERILSSLGLGVKTTLAKKYYASLSMGFPLGTHYAGKAEYVSKTRLHFVVNGQF